MDNVEEKIIFENPWVSVAEKDGYVYAKETKANGFGVALLPFKADGRIPGYFADMKYLVRIERCPAHGDEFGIYSITGMWDDTTETMDKLSFQ